MEIVYHHFVIVSADLSWCSRKVFEVEITGNPNPSSLILRICSITMLLAVHHNFVDL